MALGVASINVGKHIDKHDDDKARGVGTFPVPCGEAFARRVDQVALILIYAVIAYLVFIPHYFTPIMLIVFLAFKHALNAIKLLNNPRPKQPPQGYAFWPTWFSAVTFFHNRQFGGWLILGLIIDTLLTCHPLHSKFDCSLLAAHVRSIQINIFDFQPARVRGFPKLRTRFFPAGVNAAY